MKVTIHDKQWNAIIKWIIKCIDECADECANELPTNVYCCADILYLMKTS